ncbi:MAG: ATP-binding protein [Candidatus Thiodiazotropha sp. (ex Dulcina madagascariensis)]|nr:ATP-binding protein [Candidatus Thiodiazotropha sp. (ex Dulcina madagascariensis)]
MPIDWQTTHAAVWRPRKAYLKPIRHIDRIGLEQLVDRNDLLELPEIVDDVREQPQRFVVFCDDVTFEQGEASYRALKSVLDGSIEAPPANVLIYATSNRRHLLPEKMSENDEARLVGGDLHLSDTTEEKLALSDRFGLWLSFYPVNWQGYLAIVDSYFPDYPGDREALHEAAKQFVMARGGGKSGRAARQFFNIFSEIS